MNYMDSIYKELEKCNKTSKVHKFFVYVEGDIKEIFEDHYLIACINTKKKTFYTKYKLKGDVFLFTRHLKSLGYTPVNQPEEIQRDLIGKVIGNFPLKQRKISSIFNL